MACQCRDSPESYLALPLAIAASNLFHNFLLLGSVYFFKTVNHTVYSTVVMYNSGWWACPR